MIAISPNKQARARSHRHAPQNDNQHQNPDEDRLGRPSPRRPSAPTWPVKDVGQLTGIKQDGRLSKLTVHRKQGLTGYMCHFSPLHWPAISPPPFQRLDYPVPSKRWRRPYWQGLIATGEPGNPSSFGWRKSTLASDARIKKAQMQCIWAFCRLKRG